MLIVLMFLQLVAEKTAKKHDILFLSDCRINQRESDITKMFGLNRNSSYKVYYNSDRESRGVAIAIKRNIFHEVIETHKSGDQKCILLKIRIKGRLLAMGSIYGPNEQKPEFFGELRNKLEAWDVPFIIGGDFNTILDRSIGPDNLDNEGRGRVPNLRNSEVITNWIEQGNCAEPFRALYPEQIYH